MKYAYLAIIVTLVSNWNPFLCVNANETLSQDVDNTVRNVRDKDKCNLTAQDQSNKKPLVKSIANLRREIMRTEGLSLNAQNVKIINKDGNVVLRGPVDNMQEKTIIDNLAHKCCGINIISELEVKD